MQSTNQLYLAKAAESLLGAESEFANARYNNCANRCYYSCFQAAIHALLQAGITPPSGRSSWGHEYVQAQFVGQLIHRRKVYPASLRDILARTLILRHTADCSANQVTQTEASRSLRRARTLYAAIRGKGVEQV
jgi:uncharacterized protein (UPF0332 family)